MWAPSAVANHQVAVTMIRLLQHQDQHGTPAWGTIPGVGGRRRWEKRKIETQRTGAE